MPEQITKYPDVTLQVLREAGARCGEGEPQQILTQCPRERFCALPTGEMCIYGVEQIPQMTQIKTAEIADVVCPVQQSGVGWDAAWFAGLLALAALGTALRRR